MPLSSFLLQTVCPALLPPADAVDFEYYAVLGLSSKEYTAVTAATLMNMNSSKNVVADVRKAYKMRSLQLHPDKIAQKGTGDSTDVQAAALEYEKVQEAVHVLAAGPDPGDALLGKVAEHHQRTAQTRDTVG